MSSGEAGSARTVRLHRDLYTRSAIARAVETFADFASFAVAEDGEHYAVRIAEIDAGIEGDVVAEFCNFALANTAIELRNE